MVIYSLDIEDMTKNANVIKDVILETLERDGLLKKPAAQIGAVYAVVLHKKGWFGSLWDKWFEGIKEGSFRVTMLKA